MSDEIKRKVRELCERLSESAVKGCGTKDCTLTHSEKDCIISSFLPTMEHLVEALDFYANGGVEMIGGAGCIARAALEALDPAPSRSEA